MSKKAKKEVPASNSNVVKAISLASVVTLGPRMLEGWLAAISTAAQTLVQHTRENKRVAACAAYRACNGDTRLTALLMVLSSVAWSFRFARPCIGECNGTRGIFRYAAWIAQHNDSVYATRDNAGKVDASIQGYKDILEYIGICSANGQSVELTASESELTVMAAAMAADGKGSVADCRNSIIGAYADMNAALARLPQEYAAYVARNNARKDTVEA